jgi:hypothetical protein
VIRKAGLVIPLAAGIVLAAQRQDIVRYLKIKQMSAGNGHPENVPAGGSRAYPQPGEGAEDGTGLSRFPESSSASSSSATACMYPLGPSRLRHPA